MKKPASKRRSKKSKPEPLGHGDHWHALGLHGDELLQFITTTWENSTDVRPMPFPWPGDRFEQLYQAENPQASLTFATLMGVPPQERVLAFISAFPILARTIEWTLQVNEVLDTYGPYEGAISATAPSGHPLQWFAPYFGFEADQWRQCGNVRVALAGLALRLEKFAAEPIIITEGPAIQLRRDELRAEGRHEEADDPHLSLTYHMDEMRTIYSSYHDHHEMIGKIIECAPIRPRAEFHGRRLEVECLPPDQKEGTRLPIYVFTPALADGYTPRRSDLVRGLVWLQGRYVGASLP